VLVVPHFAEDSVSVVRRPLSGLGGIEARARAAEEGDAAVLLGQDVAYGCVAVRGAVGGDNVLCLEPLVRGEALVVLDCRLEEVDDFLVLAVLRAVAGDVEGAEAVAVLGHLVAPEARVVLVLRNPERIHVFQEVGAAKGLEEGADVGACVGEYCGAVREAIGRVGARDRVVLPAQVTILCVAAIAKVGPET
jgi:hypothetical protein